MPQVCSAIRISASGYPRINPVRGIYAVGPRYRTSVPKFSFAECWLPFQHVCIMVRKVGMKEGRKDTKNALHVFFGEGKSSRVEHFNSEQMFSEGLLQCRERSATCFMPCQHVYARGTYLRVFSREARARESSPRAIYVGFTQVWL